MSRSDWLRVTRRRPCPVCGKCDWCLISADGSAAICPRVESERRAGAGGYLHRLGDQTGRHFRRARNVRLATLDDGQTDLAQLADRYANAVNEDRLARLADSLWVSTESLQRLRIGWDGVSWTFPMVSHKGRVVGVLRRLPSGRKFSVKGSRWGLFLPSGLPELAPLLICEGPTDATALMDLGFAVIGRPSCNGASVHCARLARGRDVVIIADADEPGQRGAASLASTLRLYCPSVRVVTPPTPHKDARAWVRTGAKRADVQAVIDTAPVRQLRIETRRAPARIKVQK